MTSKSNISSAQRDIHFATEGTDGLTGFSEEQKVPSMTDALTIIGDLDPPPGFGVPASIITLETGNYTDGIVLPDFVSASCATASIVTTDAVNVTCGSSQTNRFGALVNNFLVAPVVILIDGKSRVRPIASTLSTSSSCEDGILVKLTGNCDDIFPMITRGNIRGDGTCLVENTAVSTTPIEFTNQLSEFFDDDQAGIVHNPAAESADGIYDLGTIQPNAAAVVAKASVATTSTIAHIVTGDAIIEGNTLIGAMLCQLEEDTRVTLKASFAQGDTLVKAGASAVYSAIAVMVGNTVVEDGGICRISANRIIGEMEVQDGGKGNLSCQHMTGEIKDVTGTGELFVEIEEYDGPLPLDNGNINGIINGIPYGNWAQKHEEQSVLNASDFTTQSPTGTNTPLQVLFGAAQLLPPLPLHTLSLETPS